MLYASTGSMQCFKCGDIGHRRLSCLHKEQLEGDVNVCLESEITVGAVGNPEGLS